MTSSPPAYSVATFAHSGCRNSSWSPTAGNSSASNFFAMSTTPTVSTACGPRSRRGRRSCGRRWPGRCPARARRPGPARRPCPRSGTARPTATSSAGRTAARGRPRAHFAGDGLSAPIRKRPSGSNLPLRYSLTTGSHRSLTSWRHWRSSGRSVWSARSTEPACSNRCAWAQSTAWVSAASARVQFRHVPGVDGGAPPRRPPAGPQARAARRTSRGPAPGTGEGVERGDDRASSARPPARRRPADVARRTLPRQDAAGYRGAGRRSGER